VVYLKLLFNKMKTQIGLLIVFQMLLLPDSHSQDVYYPYVDTTAVWYVK